MRRHVAAQRLGHETLQVGHLAGRFLPVAAEFRVEQVILQPPGALHTPCPSRQDVRGRTGAPPSNLRKSCAERAPRPSRHSCGARRVALPSRPRGVAETAEGVHPAVGVLAHGMAEIPRLTSSVSLPQRTCLEVSSPRRRLCFARISAVAREIGRRNGPSHLQPVT